MSFKVTDHDVTCLCALADLPKRIIVEELAPRDGRARIQLQSFTAGAVGELLDWIGPVLRQTGARVRRREGEFAFARVEVQGGLAAAAVWRAMDLVGSSAITGIAVAMPASGPLDDLGERVDRLVQSLRENFEALMWRGLTPVRPGQVLLGAA